MARAVDQTGREVALKVVNIKNEDDEINERLVMEPELMIKLRDCEHVVKLLDQDMVSGQFLVMAMELGEGTLADILNRGELTFSHVRRYWESILSCVSDLHTNNIIHCDIKPENFLFVSGNMKIIDFGLSIALPENKESVDLDQSYGTGLYVAPECLDSTLRSEDGTKRFITTIRFSINIRYVTRKIE